jgi:tetratricopeptide (TPR) repeat protein
LQRAEAYRRWARALESDRDPVAAQEKRDAARQLDPAYVEPPTEVEAKKQVVPPVEPLAPEPALEEAYPHFEKGRTLQSQQLHHEALIEFTAAITLDPEYVDAYLRRGESLLALGFPNTAIRDFNAAVRLDDRSAEAYRLQARAFAGLNQYHRAEMSATDALHVDPADAHAYAIRGEAYLAMESWDRAIADLEEAARLEPALKAQLAPTLAEAYRRREQADQQRREREAEAGALPGV